MEMTVKPQESSLGAFFEMRAKEGGGGITKSDLRLTYPRFRASARPFFEERMTKRFPFPLFCKHMLCSIVTSIFPSEYRNTMTDIKKRKTYTSFSSLAKTLQLVC